jgi:hypothetical protein
MCDKVYTNGDKWISAGMSGLLFVALSSPTVYSLVNTLTEKVGLEVADDEGCPNLQGSVMNSVIYVLLLRWMMDAKHPKNCNAMLSSKDKWILSFIGGLLFMLVSSPLLYQSVDMLTEKVGLQLVDGDCPNVTGIVVHGAIFTVIVRLLMR